jgi:predicted O-methyltransferase YrrM
MGRGIDQFVSLLLAEPVMSQMGHGQDPDEEDLGLGWIYYGLVRTLKPKTIVVIGSYRGFVPIVLRRAQLDSGGGDLHFIDPSLVDDFWKEPSRTAEHFAGFQASGIQAHLHTTQEFAVSEAFAALERVDLLFVDGYHTAEQCRLDHETFLPLMPPGSIALFHDAVRERISRIYGEDRAYTHTVCHYIDELKANPDYEVLTMPVADGLALVRHVGGANP